MPYFLGHTEKMLSQAVGVHFSKAKKYLPGADVTPLRVFKFSSGQNRTHKIV